jgi:hypothetical protein
MFCLTELQKKLGISYEDESKMALENEKRRDQLIQERQKNGLPVDDAVLDAILHQENETAGKKIKKKVYNDFACSRSFEKDITKNAHNIYLL